MKTVLAIMLSASAYAEVYECPVFHENITYRCYDADGTQKALSLKIGQNIRQYTPMSSKNLVYTVDYIFDGGLTVSDNYPVSKPADRRVEEGTVYVVKSSCQTIRLGEWAFAVDVKEIWTDDGEEYSAETRAIFREYRGELFYNNYKLDENGRPLDVEAYVCKPTK